MYFAGMFFGARWGGEGEGIRGRGKGQGEGIRGVWCYMTPPPSPILLSGASNLNTRDGCVCICVSVMCAGHVCPPQVCRSCVSVMCARHPLTLAECLSGSWSG